MATRNQLNPPPLRKITDFKSKLSGGGARSNLFEVELSFPEAVAVEGLNEVLNKSRFLTRQQRCLRLTLLKSMFPSEGES